MPLDVEGYGLLCRWPNEPERKAPDNVISLEDWKAKQALIAAVREIEENKHGPI